MGLFDRLGCDCNVVKLGGKIGQGAYFGGQEIENMHIEGEKSEETPGAA